MEISFYRYAAIVKNLRGVILCEFCESEKASWLFSRFKYRSLGFPPSIYSRLYKKKKNFVQLYYPSEAIAKVVEILSQKIDRRIAEVLVLSSTYISPLLVVEYDFSFFERNSVANIYTAKLLSDKDWKLHLRIADYSILDMYQWSTENAWKALNEGKISQALEEREEKVLKDIKRYWRITSDKGRVFLAYIDNFRLLYGLKILNDVRELGEDVAATLAIIPAVLVY